MNLREIVDPEAVQRATFQAPIIISKMSASLLAEGALPS
jgi:hypothetical protein